MKTYNQIELLELVKQYNSTDRLIIKKNLKICMIKYSFTLKDIIEKLEQPKSKVYSWTNMTNSNIPKFEDMLNIAIQFDFDVKELIEEN